VSGGGAAPPRAGTGRRGGDRRGLRRRWRARFGLRAHRRDIEHRAAIGAYTPADQHSTQENDDGDDRRSHEQEDNLLPIQLNFVKALFVDRHR
jgi:hypothetical protein